MLTFSSSTSDCILELLTCPKTYPFGNRLSWFPDGKGINVDEEIIDPHSQKEDSEIHKIPKFGVNQASFD